MISSWAADETGAGGWIRRGFEAAQKLKREIGEDAVADLSIGQPLEADEAVREAFANAASDRRPHRFGYMSNLGFMELRERVAEDVHFPGVTASSIAVTVGASGAISTALRTFVNSGEEIVGFIPYFPEFSLYADVMGCAFRPVATLASGEIDFTALEKVITPKTGAVILNTPCNPSGHVVAEVEMRQLAELLLRKEREYARNIWLIADEVYRNLIYPPFRRSEPFAFYEHCILARSFSKDLGVAGERIGYLALHPAVTSREAEEGLALSMRALGFVNAPATAQIALLNLANWRGYADQYRERRDLVTSSLNEAGLAHVECQGGLYYWVKSPLENTLEYVDALIKERTFVVPGVAFGDEAYFRICFSASLEALAIARTAFSALASRVG